MDIAKTIQFILDTQAHLEATASQHDERLARLETSIATLGTSVSTVTDLVGRLA
jgi:hypothetical protein